MTSSFADTLNTFWRMSRGSRKLLGLFHFLGSDYGDANHRILPGRDVIPDGTVDACLIGLRESGSLERAATFLPLRNLPRGPQAFQKGY